jgi:hypothetical protein
MAPGRYRVNLPETGMESESYKALIREFRDVERVLGQQNAENERISTALSKVAKQPNPGLPYPYEDVSDPTGWIDNDNIVESYNPATRTVTVTHPDELAYRTEGVKTAIPGNSWTSTAHDDTPGLWFCYFDLDGVEQWTPTPWEFWEIPIFAVRYFSATQYIPFREVHGLMPWTTHRRIHNGGGTIRAVSDVGGFATGYTPYDITDRPGSTFGRRHRDRRGCPPQWR